MHHMHEEKEESAALQDSLLPDPAKHLDCHFAFAAMPLIEDSAEAMAQKCFDPAIERQEPLAAPQEVHYLFEKCFDPAIERQEPLAAPQEVHYLFVGLSQYH
jgi:hypothetical protein